MDKLNLAIIIAALPLVIAFYLMERVARVMDVVEARFGRGRPAAIHPRFTDNPAGRPRA